MYLCSFCTIITDLSNIYTIFKTPLWRSCQIVCKKNVWDISYDLLKWEIPLCATCFWNHNFSVKLSETLKLDGSVSISNSFKVKIIETTAVCSTCSFVTHWIKMLRVPVWFKRQHKDWLLIRFLSQSPRATVLWSQSTIWLHTQLLNKVISNYSAILHNSYTFLFIYMVTICAS